MLRRVNFGILAAILALACPASASNPTGSADQVLVIPHAGGLAKFGQVDLSQTAATKSQLSTARGGTGLDTSTSTGRPKIASGTWSLANIDLTSEVTGALPAANGGTGLNNSAATGFQKFSSGTGSVAALANTDIPVSYYGLNLLANAGFDFWQRTGTSSSNVLVGVNGGATTVYGPDRWYIRNALSGSTTAGVITYSDQTGSLNGSLRAAQLKITTAPVGSPVNGTELWQVLENPLAISLYNQTASFGIQVKGLGNVNQVGLQFFFATSEVKPSTANNLGSEATCTVNTSTFVQCSDLNIALGTSMTTAGAIAVRVRITGVSSGNTYDLNNGFAVEQGQTNIGSTLAPWRRMGYNPGSELAYCQRFYQKSYDVETAPATATLTGESAIFAATPTSTYGNIFLKVPMRAIPTFLGFSRTGSSGQWYDQNASLVRAIDTAVAYRTVVQIAVTPTALNHLLVGHYTADADI